MLVAFYPCKTGHFHSQKGEERSSEMAKKALKTLIICLFLSLAVCPAGLADSRRAANSHVLSSFRQQQTSTSLVSFLMLGGDGSALIHLPFVEAVVSARDLLWTEILNWDATPSFAGKQWNRAAAGQSCRSRDVNPLGAEDRMAISLHHGVGTKRGWNVSLDLGIALQNNSSREPVENLADAFSPDLRMDSNNQHDDVLDELKDAAPFIGVGITCRF